ncbi:MAG: hypothetical protein Q4G66_12300 [bacterium]|nr:hypothetical protein [bacterium]
MTQVILLNSETMIKSQNAMRNENPKVPAFILFCDQGTPFVLEKLAVSLLASPGFKMMECRFRATDRNLTVLLRRNGHNQR